MITAETVNAMDQIRPLARDRDLDHRHRLSVHGDIDSRWLAASGELCPVCGSRTRYTPDVLDELAAVAIGTGGSARQIAADPMSEEHLAAAKLRFPRPPPDQGS